MHFERLKMHKGIYFIFFRKKIIKKNMCPTLPKMFRSVTRNTLIFLFGLIRHAYNLPISDHYIVCAKIRPISLTQNNFIKIKG